MKNQNCLSISRSEEIDLLTLALDCTVMVNELSESLTLQAQGDHRSALARLKSVEDRIDTWVEQLDEVETRKVEKKDLVVGLREAKKAVESNIGDKTPDCAP